VANERGSDRVSGAVLRQKFLRYFEGLDHAVVKSASLVPHGDDTLLFTNAGMVQFKDVFTGQEKRDYKRATTAQKCVRAGGKHNDLENVGRTARHHTFFEMLGNFSFGDYFKEDACRYAWRFLTEELHIPAEKLSVTVFGGENGLPPDEDAERIWRDVVGVPAAKITRHGAKDNFWQMGDTGPCGPCTEIHFERGVVEGTFGGDDPEGDRVLEVWNLVFMQYERKSDGTLVPLPAPSVDTGMGLERLTMVMNACASNYDTDLLRPVITHVENLLKKKYTSSDNDDDVAMRVIADHARTAAFLIADGVQPGNGKRDYVLRRIMRRAVLHGERLGFTESFLHECCAIVVRGFGDAYPELKDAAELIRRTVVNEEELFRQTLSRGLLRFERASSGLAKNSAIDGGTVFDLYATFGFPPDLTEILAKERGLTIDEPGFEKAKERHSAISGGGLGVHGTDEILKTLRQELGATTFTGYESTTGSGRVVAILKDGARTDALKSGEHGQILLDQTPFYGESGGQVGDSGTLSADGVFVRVDDCVKSVELHVHTVAVEQGVVRVGTTMQATVDDGRLADTRRNHSATHLLHKALRDVLGTHVAQKGSLVAPDRLRFDYAHFEGLKENELRAVEDQVNAMILANKQREAKVMGFDEAKTVGAMALFGEKYGDRVRVVSMGDSVELCGGIHVERTGDIGLFKITAEGPLASGIRRLEAVTGRGALAHVRERSQVLAKTAQMLRVSEADVPERVEKLRAELRSVEKELEKFRQKAATDSAGKAADTAKDVAGIRVITERVSGVDPKNLRDYADKLRDKLGSGVVVLGVPTGDDKCTLLVALTKDLVGRLHAGKIVAELAPLVDGKGGGKPDLAQAGGTNPSQIDAALLRSLDVIAAQAG
jgi:alanyl-tRNA synthetase